VRVLLACLVAVRGNGGRQIPLFAGLTEEQLQYVQQGNEIRLRPGEYVKRAGEPPDGFYIVIEGQVEWTSRVGQQDVYVMTLADGSSGATSFS
jgi:signal-transduction protein with cAMP-binding, CBS, and nucleotidyltransferase domain